MKYTNKKFTCPVCDTKITWKELFIFKKNHVTFCTKCKSHLKPKNPKSFQWGFALGFLGCIIPGYISIYIYHDFRSLLVGLISSILSIIIVVVYLFLTIEFIEY